MADQEAPLADEDIYTKANPSKFRFKSKKKRRHDDDNDNDGDKDDSGSTKRRREHHDPSPRHHRSSRHHHHNHHSSKPKPEKLFRGDDPSLYDDDFEPQATEDAEKEPSIPFSTRTADYADPKAAFRESLFDALADDEGAEYWEGVYGQPIHTYARPGGRTGANNWTDDLDDEAYAEYVRAQMWRKTHEHVVEERARREEMRQRQREWEKKTRGMEEEREGLERRVEESLRRGRERKERGRWKEAWKRYLEMWEGFKNENADEVGEGKAVRAAIPWPVVEGSWKGVEKENVEEFFKRAPDEGADLYALLKVERVRWHPDKIQQRFGGEDVDKDTMKAVTAVFQVVDAMWNAEREKKKSNG
ncbi:hypothetical protein K402DRAFT_389242 [Aulographum hederae CBS 113979]|uniref:J domain-containing protein n=1 Tax=Aulographum hederae CBS 113979 TaxID=1176131 RepID=A0A6G1HCU9_9PEZI|nr:hypothetical protein K402DRAFT_389242 [Aulographum hederae CBS 113979]